MSDTHADEAFATFVSGATASLTRTAWLLTGNSEAAADLVQAALVKTYLAWDRLDPARALAYARKIVVNENIDRWRRRHGEVQVGADFDRAASGSLEDRVADRDRVTRMLATLPRQQRQVIVLRYYNDLSEQQTAEHLDIPVGAVKSAAHRGLAALRAHYPADATEGGRA